MELPFTTAQFLDVMRRYNEAVWPVQWALLVLGACAVTLAVRAGASGGRAVAAILAALWIWMGLAYHLAFFRTINPAASLFAALFVLEGGLLLWLGARRGRLAFRVRADLPGAVGAALALYALVGYPALGYALGHRYPAAPTFGLPCPTTILTLALFAWARPRPPLAVLVVPFAWALLGTSAALQLGMREDFGLVAAAVLAAAALAVGVRRGSGRGAAPARPRTSRRQPGARASAPR